MSSETDDDSQGGGVDVDGRYDPTAPSSGLYQKFRVSRTDGRSRKGQKHHECDYLVLDWVHDPFAIPAARAYADACENQYPLLAADIRRRADAAERKANDEQ